MKLALSTAIVTITLSTLIWIYFYFATPDAPLSAHEMVFIVGATLLVVLSLQFLWRRFRKDVR